MTSSLGPSGFNNPANSIKSSQTAAKKSGKSDKGKNTKKADSAAKQPVDTATLTGAKAALLGKALGVAKDPTEGAKEIPGLFKVLQKDDKAWLSLKPDQLNKPFFFSVNVSKGVGEKRLVASEMGDAFLAEFRKFGDQIQLVALHTENFATPGTPQEQFVREGYADSLLSSAPVVPSEGKDIRVDANALLFKDIPAYRTRLTQAYQSATSPFQLDAGNTHFTGVDNSETQTSFGVQAHYTSSNPAKGASTTPVPNSVLPEFRYNFLKLPDTPMTPRLADERIGHFVTTRKDYTGDEGDGVVRYVNRWRLEKKDPDAKVSEPVQPITYWIAKDVPENYRDAVKNGILEWNKAFEAIGYKNAIQVKQQKASDEFDTLDARHASVRWYTAADVGSAVGPSQVDPRSGEILDADIRMADVFGRSAKRFIMENAPEDSKAHDHEEHGHLHDGHACEYQEHAAIEQQFASGLLEARGDIKASEELAKAYVKDVVMHEVGHTLGLRHNFKGSTVYTPDQLQDANFTKEHGLGSSVMDYHPFNLAAPGEKQGEYVMSTLGPYDYLAIKYAYEPIEAGKEKDTLNEIARQTTTDPNLAYETDEAADDMDPEVTRFDLGNDPLKFAEKQVGLAKELLEKAQTRELPQDASYKELTRAFQSGLSKISSATTLMSRYIGGTSIRRDRAGTDNPIYSPVPAERQREALHQIVDTLYRPDSFKFSPQFVSRLAKERFGNWGDQNIHPGQMVTRVQGRVLNHMLEDEVAQRIIDNPDKLAEGAPVFKLSELYQGLESAIWSEVSDGKEISQSRRDLQREYLKSVAPIIDENGTAPGEARSIMRYLTGKLKERIDVSLKQEMSLERRAHLEDCSHTIAEALAGPKE